MAYPCVCSSYSYTPSSSSGCGSGTCLRVPRNMLISAEDSIAGCGQSGELDIAALSDLTACTGTVTWGLYATWDTAAFSSASIDAAGVLSFTSTEAAQLSTPYLFTGVAACPDTLLSQYFEVTIFIKNECSPSTVCGEGFVCNPCTGSCVAEVDVEVS